jgi:bifunctional DNase/RNase
VDKIKLDILGLSASKIQSGSFALLMGEEHGNRRLPIIIGMFEAQAIAIEMERIVPHRPMTHDLFKPLAAHFGFKIEEVYISDLKEGVFYAKIICSNEEKRVEIDARPSDAIAIAIRFKVPVFTNEAVLQEGGITMNEYEDEKTPEAPKAVKKSSSSTTNELSDIETEKLEKMLKEALSQEEYEKAARIRDELKRRGHILDE